MLKRAMLAVSVLVPLSAQAQANPDSVKHRNECRLAVQVLTTGRPAVKTGWAVRQMRTCPETAEELAQGLRAARTSRDTSQLNLLTAPTDWLRDGRIFSAAAEVLQDRTAAPTARVYAARVLMWAYVPGQEIRFGHLVDVDGDGDWSCGGLGPSLHGELARGAPLPSGWMEQGRTLGRSIALAADEPAIVRQAATCLAMVIPFPHLRDTR
jgi:hypothetical protein